MVTWTISKFKIYLSIRLLQDIPQDLDNVVLDLENGGRCGGDVGDALSLCIHLYTSQSNITYLLSHYPYTGGCSQHLTQGRTNWGRGSMKMLTTNVDNVSYGFKKAFLPKMV